MDRQRRPWRIVMPGIGLVIRMGIVLGTMGIALAGHEVFTVVPWALAVAGVDALIVLFRHLRPAEAQRWLPFLIAGLTAIATVAFQVAGMPAVLLILVATFHAGTALGRWGVAISSWAAVVVAFAMTAATRYQEVHGWEIIWWLAFVAISALVATFWHTPPEDQAGANATEATLLLNRLNSLADSLDTGFDVPAAGDRLLAEIADDVAVERAAVLIHDKGEAVVIGLQGHTRMPWLAPTDEESVLRKTWVTGSSTRGSFTDTRTRHFLLTLPISDAEERVIGMVALDRAEKPFSNEDQILAERVIQRVEPLLEVGLMFSKLRGKAALEERNRLARDMHDGVAQELAALSFQVDMLVSQVPQGDPLHGSLVGLGQSLRQSLGDIRSQISTLRMVERPDVSLGALLSSQLQTFGSANGVRTKMTLEESPFRFAAHVEMQMHRLALDFINEARASGAKFIDFDVWLAAPNAILALRHDGVPVTGPEIFTERSHGPDADVSVEDLIPYGRYVEVVVGERPEGARPFASGALSSSAIDDGASSATEARDEDVVAYVLGPEADDVSPELQFDLAEDPDDAEPYPVGGTPRRWVES